MAELPKTEESKKIVILKDKDFFKHFNLEIVKVLGKGLDGKVFLASSPGGLMAVKIFDRTQRNPRRVCRFVTEFMNMQKLSHPHLVPCFHVARCKDYFAFSMPYYSGGDLVPVLQGRRPMDTAAILRCMLEVTFAVEYLHMRCLAHNDIKLDNVFLDSSGRAHLGDLGFVKNVTTACRTTLACSLGGTPSYWGPERFQEGSLKRVDPFKGDVYSIGVMCWLLVSKDKQGENVDYQTRVKTATDLCMSPSLRSALEQMLEPDPAKRPTVSNVLQLLIVASRFYE
ncbi:serine/threonine-protein kinase MARK1 [Elysia marginata]|uniref:Serine/threonine-protein kinase MARK1 n=1 Tax=Elysia marginata TaxID=1093978 RepID=A0AAV4FYI2_9GAST|nr:serine/threonine-protein kinase MARK1 [Elysia marginata]